MESPHFLLVGNGPYLNRGCEAIVRGTMTILRSVYGSHAKATVATLSTDAIVSIQAKHEWDHNIAHIPLSKHLIKRWSIPWWRRQLIYRWLPTSCDSRYSCLDSLCSQVSCAMQIGGDNYTYDYRLPDIFVDLDRYLIRHKVPIILWGCSVGPFDSIPAYHKYIIDHFKAMKYIFPRESISYNYLIKNKLNNVMLMSDPAFLLEACAPESIKFNVPLSGRYVGLNLSPLIAKYVTGGDMGALVKCASNIVRNIVAITNMSVLLIPHVTLDTNDDYIFLRNVYDSCDKTIKPYVYCVSNNLTAAETKWVISRCEIFIGARMHSVIAALSSCIPTLTLSYSSKSVGLNYDIYGNMDCLVVMDKYFESNILAKLEYILSNKSNISKHLCVNMPHVTDNALSAGKYLKHLLSTR